MTNSANHNQPSFIAQDGTSLQLPSFFIIGERKCGTSSLYRYITAHPRVLPGVRKEMQFFTKSKEDVHKGFEDYLRGFPQTSSDSASCRLHWPELNESGKLFCQEINFSLPKDGIYQSGEASADTLCNVAPALLKEYLPELRLLVVLRDPVLRAYSHHRMLSRFVKEGRDLGFSLHGFTEDMSIEIEQQKAGQTTTFLSPGLYAQNLLPWFKVWGQKKIMVLLSSQIATQEARRQTMPKVFEFLGFKPLLAQPKEFAQRFNQAPKAKIPPSAANTLYEFYQQPNQDLEQLLQRNIPWKDSKPSQGINE